MHKTFLFPTDLTVASLNIVRTVLQGMRDGQTCRIILLHGYKPPTSITDLLFSSRESWLRSISNPEFDEACEVIQNKFESRITALVKDVFMGFTQAAFNGYLEANAVDEIYLPRDHKLRHASKRSFDLGPYIRKSGLAVNEVRLQVPPNIPEKDMVAEVFRDRIVLQ